MKSDEQDVLMTADVARVAGVTPAAVRHWESRGWLRAKKTVSGRRLFLRVDVEAFIQKRGMRRVAR